jgi:hypothetical protein
MAPNVRPSAPLLTSETRGTPYLNIHPVSGSVASSMLSPSPPTTWAMMILGFAGVGFMTYRRRNKKAMLRVA